MKLHVQSWFFVVLSVLLISASARPHPIASENASAETTDLAERDGFSLFGIHLLPRLPLKLGGLKSSPKPAPAPVKPAPAPVKPAPAPVKPVPAPAKSVPPPAKSNSPPAKASPPPAAKPSPPPSKSVSSQASAASDPSVSSASSKSTVSSASKSSAISSATPTPTPSASDSPRKCNTNGCGAGGACALKRDTDAQTSPAFLGKRAFGVFSKESDVAKLQKASGTVDLSAFGNRDGSFTPFGTKPLAAAVTGLEGCAMVVAMSNQGMQVSHMFESSQDNEEVQQTLHPQFFQKTVAAVGARFAANRDKFQGGQAVVMLPMNPQNPTLFKYESEVSDAFNTKTGKLDKRLKKVQGPGTVKAITDMVVASTGLQPKIIQYTPPATDAQAKANLAKDSILGTFVAQYDPKNAPGQAAVQVFGEGNAALSPAFSFTAPTA